MEQAAPADAALAEPIPQRFWWLKRLTVAAAVFAFVLAGAWLWWRHHAARMLHEQVQAIRARGEPVLVEDFYLDPVPDAQNAAHYYIEAAKFLDEKHLFEMAQIPWPSPWPPPKQWIEIAQDEVASHQRSLELARQARTFDSVRWPGQSASRLAELPLPHLQRARRLSFLLRDAAIHAHVSGNGADAIERIFDLLALSRALSAQPRFLISRLLAVGINSTAASSAALIAPDLSSESRSPASRAAPPERVKQLVLQLLEQSDSLEPLRQALHSERALQYDYVQWLTQESLVLRPMFDREAMRVLRNMENQLPAAEQSNRQSARARIPPPQPPSEGPRRITRTFSEGFRVPSRALEQEFRSRTCLRLAAVSLAVRLYVIGQGRYPPNLKSLVPEYLPYVPKDPMSPDDAELRYVLLDGDRRPIVYSVSEDGRDDTSKGVAPPAEPQYDWINGYADQWRDLSRWTPPEE